MGGQAGPSTWQGHSTPSITQNTQGQSSLAASPGALSRAWFSHLRPKEQHEQVLPRTTGTQGGGHLTPNHPTQGE